METGEGIMTYEQFITHKWLWPVTIVIFVILYLYLNHLHGWI